MPIIRKQQLGFSLLELIVVLSLVGLLAGIVATSLGRGVSSAEIRNASKKVAASLRYTRSYAIQQHEEQVFLIDIENRQWKAPNRPAVDFPKDMEITIVTARSEMTGEKVGGIRFFPDGSSTGGNVTLQAKNKEWQVGVEWLTGEITRGELIEAELGR